ncbi:Leucine Rich repeats (2 copies) [Gimesia algae]|uniref:Leucine Rich repeats (2 copies) n=2 Tax=Gimesia algae TaxID=2527971 RepID=A0A517VH48_9PLAN|nr:Leucine Rich repeats (2 copies) [Gimesia algae]
MCLQPQPTPQFIIGCRNLRCCWMICFCLLSLTSCSRQKPAPRQTKSSTPVTPKSSQPATPRIMRIDLAENSYWKREDKLQKITQTTEPICIDLTWSEIGDDLLDELNGKPNLQELILFGSDITDEKLRKLGELPNLQLLNLGGCHVTLEGILQLSSSRNLKQLHVPDVQPRLDDQAVARFIETWPHLESLGVGSSDLTDAGLSQIGKLKQLQWLNISRTQVTGSGLSSLTDLPHLKTLHANDTHVSDPAMIHIGKMTNMEKLILNGTDVSDRGFQEVQNLKKLYCICFVGSRVSDRGLKYLKPLKAIEFIGAGDNASPEALQKLEEILPFYKKNG